MAGSVIGHFMRIYRPHVCNLKHIHQILRELKYTRGDVNGKCMLRRAGLEQGWIMVLDHTDTGTRRANERRVAFAESTQKVQRHRAGLLFETIVEERLSATGLLRR